MASLVCVDGSTLAPSAVPVAAVSRFPRPNHHRTRFILGRAAQVTPSTLVWPRKLGNRPVRRRDLDYIRKARVFVQVLSVVQPIGHRETRVKTPPIAIRIGAEKTRAIFPQIARPPAVGGVVEFNAVNQEHSNCRHQVLLYSGSRPLSQAKLWCSAALRFRGAKARLRNLTGVCECDVDPADSFRGSPIAMSCQETATLCRETS